MKSTVRVATSRSRARACCSRLRTWMLLIKMPAPASIAVNTGPMNAAMISESIVPPLGRAFAQEPNR